MRAHPAIAYDTAPLDDAAARLNRRLAEGSVTLSFEPGTGYLKSVLDAFSIPVDSQVLVFSKTSFQAPRINPSNPRALYFNDTVSIGWVRGGEVLEVVAQDPKQGAIFYTLPQEPGATRFTRSGGCVLCHTSEATENVPGMFLGSVYPAADGMALYAPAYMTDHRTPFELRWGGWYVTGKHRLASHLGNSVFPEVTVAPTQASVHLESLDGRFDRTGYLGAHSDIVALMVLEHQARMLNLFTRIGWDARIGKAAGTSLAENAKDVVDYMLYVHEAPLPGRIEGPTTFAKTFAAQGPHDSRGRSLRDLDLQTRMMRYTLSFLIYSEPFDAIPPAAKDAIYARLWKVLSGQDADAQYAGLTAADRQAILEILRETKPDLPGYFKADGVSGP
jgi:hypothetical protein